MYSSNTRTFKVQKIVNGQSFPTNQPEEKTCRINPNKRQNTMIRTSNSKKESVTIQSARESQVCKSVIFEYAELVQEKKRTMTEPRDVKNKKSAIHKT